MRRLSGCKIKAIAITTVVMILLWCIIISSDVALAYHADIFEIMAINGSSFEPVGADMPGTAAHTVTSWNGTPCIGNLGIGNGSLANLKQESHEEAELPEKNSSATDEETLQNETKANTTEPVIHINSTEPENRTDNTVNQTEPKETGNQTEPKETEPEVDYTDANFMAVGVSVGNSSDAITILRPVKDILYEAPDAVDDTAYMRLVGLKIGGNNVSVGARTLD